MFQTSEFPDLHLVESLSISEVSVVDGPIEDLFGQSAAGKTLIAGGKLHIQILSSQSDEEKSVTLYHEILEAITVAATFVPGRFRDFAERDFEREGYRAFNQFGPASPSSLAAMLQFHGFKRQ
jgi:hypothetical protein